MEEKEKNDEVVRKPILTASNRRNAENHPEFLDTEALLERFEPLLKSIHKHFCSFDGVFDQQEDITDLYSQIQLEFLRLRRSFDPKRGVDFPGYIKFHLQQRVYHYVTKKQKLVNNEQPVRTYGEDNEDQPIELENFSNLVDEEASSNFEKAEALASIPWDDLDEEQAQLVRDILINGETIESLAKRKKVSMKSIKQKLDDVCEVLIDLYNLNTYRDE